jgi:hypothetical protein
MKMEREDAIKYLENLQQGDFLTVNIPIIADKKIQVTAMYVGKDKEERYNFIDSGNFILSKEFLEKGNISIDKEYNGDIATDIYAKFKREQERKNKQKKHNRDYR